MWGLVCGVWWGWGVFVGVGGGGGLDVWVGGGGGGGGAFGVAQLCALVLKVHNEYCYGTRIHSMRYIEII